MTTNWTPQGKEREVTKLSGATIDGTPTAYIVVLAAVVTALSFIPFSIVLSTGGSMPLSQAVLPLLGWLLGPIAAMVGAGIGAMIGVFLAPYTAGVPALSIGSAMLTALVAGLMGKSRNRPYWWLIVSILSCLSLFLYAHHAIANNGVDRNIVIAGSFIDWSGLLLFILPTRRLFARWIGSQDIKLLALGLFFGTWMASGLSHLTIAMIAYYIFNWPEEVWVALIPIIPIENLLRSIGGVVIGTGVIAGLRAMKMVKPPEAIY
ncbi:MAG: ECF transporter S component [Microcystaceae cyanobacterium]